MFRLLLLATLFIGTAKASLEVVEEEITVTEVVVVTTADGKLVFVEKE